VASLKAGALEDLEDRVLATPRKAKRRLVAIVGAPASGKSTLAEQLVGRLVAAGCAAQLVPMDGFHLHNPILEARGLLDRKGAPETFDATGLLRLVERLGHEDDIYYPVFERARDISIAGAGYIGTDCDTVMIEGNYLLLDAPVWRQMKDHWDVSVMLDVPLPVLRARLIQRWLDHGLSQSEAEARAQGNDLPNARLVAESSTAADWQSDT